MKRYLTIGIIFGVLLIVVVTISWFAFPGWRDPASGGFWVLLGIAVVAVWTFVKDGVSVWKDLREEKKEEPKPTPAPLQSVQSQQGENIYNAPGGKIVIQQPTQPPASKKVKEQLNTGWFFGHRYGDLATFTGRETELKMLDEWLANGSNNLLVLTALGGFGKSALTWQWFNNRVDKTKWPTAVWWSFYEKESGFESFLAEILNHLGVEVKASARLQLNDLLEAMRGTNILIVLDGFERLLRQYGRMDAALQSDDEDADIDPSQRDCSSPLTETFLRGLSGAGMKSKVLMTTRLCPRALESADGKLLKGCREEPLAAFSPEDAVTYFHNEGIKAMRAEISEACAAYGYHPLSLSLLVGLINADHERRGDIAAVKNLKIFEDVKARRHHVLERAYGSLAPERRDLLSKISCFRGSMEYAVLRKVFPSPDLDKALLDLRKRGLLQYVSPLLVGAPFGDDKGAGVRYDMHPIVRHYAYDHFTDEKRRKEAHVQLAEHFIDAMPVTNTKVKTLEDLAPVIELYHHMVGAGNLDEACDLFYSRLQKPTYYQFGAYQLRIELLRALFPDGEDKPARLKKESDQAWATLALAQSYARSGQPHDACSLLNIAIELQQKNNNEKAISFDMAESAIVLFSIGRFVDAGKQLLLSKELLHSKGEKFGEAKIRAEVGTLLSFLGKWDESEKELYDALNQFYMLYESEAEGEVWAKIVQRLLLMVRAKNLPTDKNYIIEYAKSSFEKIDEFKDLDGYGIYLANYVRAHWLLGVAYRVNNELTLAEENLSKALNLCRQINAVEAEADILLDLARLSFAYALREAQGSAQDKLFKDAQEKASEALVITERCGYVLQGADVQLFLAELAMDRRLEIGDWEAVARRHAEDALKLATCDGPPYYYKVAYEEAERMLEKLKDER